MRVWDWFVRVFFGLILVFIIASVLVGLTWLVAWLTPLNFGQAMWLTVLLAFVGLVISVSIRKAKGVR